MKQVITLLVLSLFVSVYCGCKKQAPDFNIDELAGSYKVSGSISFDTTLKRNLIDSVLLISKVNGTTLQFISGVCDTLPVFGSINLVYDWENDTLILFSNMWNGDHSPNSASLFFHNPPDGNFTFNSMQYCGFFVNTSLAGTKIH